MSYQSYLELNIENLGYSELKELRNLLDCFLENKACYTRLMDNSPCKIGINMDYGNIFFIDDDYNIGMVNHQYDKMFIDDFISCPDCSFEGFPLDIIKDGQKCCKLHLREVYGINFKEIKNKYKHIKTRSQL